MSDTYVIFYSLQLIFYWRKYSLNSDIYPLHHENTFLLCTYYWVLPITFYFLLWSLEIVCIGDFMWCHNYYLMSRFHDSLAFNRPSVVDFALSYELLYLKSFNPQDVCLIRYFSLFNHSFIVVGIKKFYKLATSLKLPIW